MPIFRVKSVKIYTGHFFYTDMSVVSVTNIRYDRQDQMIKEGDLMMISESDVFISTDRVLQPLDNAGYKAWIYWVCNLSSKNILTTSFACLFANHLKLGFFVWNLPCVKKIEQRWSLPSMEVKRLQCRSQHSERWNGNIRLRKHCS